MKQNFNFKSFKEMFSSQLNFNRGGGERAEGQEAKHQLSSPQPRYCFQKDQMVHLPQKQLGSGSGGITDHA